MNGFEAYKTYLAVTSHFKNKKYDYFKYNGIANAGRNSYDVRNDKYLFEKASKIFKRDDYVKYLVAHMTSNSDEWFGNRLNKNSEIYTKWKRHMEAFSYVFKQEIRTLYEAEQNFNKLFKTESGTHPQIFRLYLKNKVSIETLIILDSLVKFSKYWRKQDDMMMTEAMDLMEKYKPFLFMFTKPELSKFKTTTMEIFK